MTLPLFDLERVRRDTRACNDIIHFNNAGAALMPVPVADSMHTFLDQEERFGAYETQNKQQALLDNFYTAASTLLNCQPNEIAFIENATRAWDMAFYSFRFSPGDKVLTNYAEYGSNVIAYLHQAKQCGVEIVFVPNDDHGQINPRALQEMIDDRVKLISICHIPTGGGLVSPVNQIGQIARNANIPFLLDACQSIGQLDLDVEKIACDMLSGTGRKYLRGPRGTGLLYVRQSLLEKLNPPFLDLHAANLISATEYKMRKDAKRFENWEQACAAKAAFGVAIDYALSLGLKNIQSRDFALGKLLRQQLELINGVEVMDEGLEQCAIVTFRAKQKTPIEIKHFLAKNHINVTTSAGSGSLVSYQKRGIEMLVRASLHYYNTEHEIEQFCRCLKQNL